jgi:hypothetical protein
MDRLVMQYLRSCVDDITRPTVFVISCPPPQRYDNILMRVFIRKPSANVRLYGKQATVASNGTCLFDGHRFWRAGKKNTDRRFAFSPFITISKCVRQTARGSSSDVTYLFNFFPFIIIALRTRTGLAPTRLLGPTISPICARAPDRSCGLSVGADVHTTTIRNDQVLLF